MITQAYLSDLLRLGAFGVVLLATIAIYIDKRLYFVRTNILYIKINSRMGHYCRNNYLLLQFTIALALIMFILFVSGRNGVIIGPDTEARFEVTRQILDGTVLQKASSDRPPVLPLLVAAVHVIFDTSFEESIQFVNGFLFAGNLLLITRVILVSTQNCFLAYIGLLTAFLSGHFRLLHVQSGEEPMHILVTLLSMLFVLRYMQNQNVVELFTAAFFVSMAPLVKNAGILTPIAFCIVVALVYKNNKISRNQFVALFISSILILSAWQLRHWLVGQPSHYAPLTFSGAYTRIWSTLAYGIAILTHYILGVEIKSIIAIAIYVALVATGLVVMYRGSDVCERSDLLIGHLYHHVHFFGVIFIVVISPVNFIGLLQHLGVAFVCTIPMLYITLHIVSNRLVGNEHTI